MLAPQQRWLSNLSRSKLNLRTGDKRTFLPKLPMIRLTVLGQRLSITWTILNALNKAPCAAHELCVRRKPQLTSLLHSPEV